MSLLDRTNTLSKDGPSSLLPPDERPAGGPREAAIPKQGPSSLLDSGLPPESWREIDRPRQSPSSLLDEDPSVRHAGPSGDEVVAVSPSELLSPAVEAATFPWRRVLLGVAVAGAIAIAIAAFVAPRLMREPTSELIQEAITAIESGRNDVAALRLKNVLQRERDNGRARYLLGKVNHVTGDFAGAEQELRFALDLGYDRARVLPALARALLLRGEFQRVLDEIPPAVDGIDAGVVLELRTLRGLAYVGLGTLEEAQILFKEVLAAKPDSVDALLGTARIAAIERRPDQAFVLVERALAVEPRNLDALLIRGQLEWASGRIEPAKIAFRKVLDSYPGNPYAHTSLAWLAVEAEQYGQARTHVDVARKGAPSAPHVKFLDAFLEYRQRNYESARMTLEEIRKVTPNDAASLLLAGAVAYAEADYAKAKDSLSRGLARVPGHVGGRKLYAATLLNAGGVSAALKVLLPMLDGAPGDADLLTLVGRAYLQAENVDVAAQYLERAARIDPKETTAPMALGLAQMASGRLDPALSAVESGLRADASSGEVDALLVRLNLKRQNIALAERAWDVLLKKQPNAPATLQLRGEILAAKGDMLGARKALETALMLEPGYSPAAIQLAKLDLKENDASNARRRLEKLARANPREVQGLVALAELGSAIRATEDEIRNWLLEANKADPTAVRPAVLLARHHLRSGNPADALAVVRAAYRIHPESTELLEALGAAQVAAGDMAGALGTYSILVSLMPNSAEVLYRLAQSQLAAGSDVAASISLNKALAIKADHEGALTVLGGIYQRGGRYPDALNIARLLQISTKTAAKGHALEGEIMLATDKPLAAVPSFERALQLSPTSAYLIGWHTAMSRSGSISAADQRLARWLSERKDDTAVRTHWADSQFRRNNFEEARQHYLAAVQQGAVGAALFSNLAWSMFKTGDKQARAYAERAFEIAPDDAAVLDTLGVILMSDGDLVRALDLLQRAVSQAPAAAEPRIRLAEALIKAGNYAKARVELQSLLRLKLSPARSADVRAMLEQLPH